MTVLEAVYAVRTNALFDAHQDDQEFGHRFLADEARAAGKKAGPPVHKYLVLREFTVSSSNELWLPDISEHWTAEGNLYRCAAKDVYARRIVGYSISDRMRPSVAVDALNSAGTRHGDVSGCVVHSDRGPQFRSRRFVGMINRHEMVGSMARVGAAADNAAMKSFFSLLRKDILNRRPRVCREAMVTWIEQKTSHRRHGQARLGCLTPIECETIMNTTTTLAA